MINPVELMRIFKEINTKMDLLIEDNKSIHTKLDMLVHAKELQYAVSVWETNTKATDSVTTVSTDGSVWVNAEVIRNSPVVTAAIQTKNIYEQFKEIQAKDEYVTSIISGRQTGLVYILFYKTGCGGCEPVLKSLQEQIGMDYLKSSSMLIVPRDHSFATQLTQKFKVRTYPSLLVIENNKSIKNIEGNLLVSYLKDALKL